VYGCCQNKEIVTHGPALEPVSSRYIGIPAGSSARSVATTPSCDFAQSTGVECPLQYLPDHVCFAHRSLIGIGVSARLNVPGEMIWRHQTGWNKCAKKATRSNP
jgi:hypothetical protein